MKKIVVAFLALLFGCANFYAQVGTLDSSFGNGGIATSPFMSNGDDVAKDVKIQSDGKILVGGISSGGLTNDFVIARYLINGDLDPTFGNGGFVKTDISGYDDTLTRLFLQNDEKIIAIGYGKFNNSAEKGIVIRYNQNGTIDTSFGSDGFTLIQIPTSIYEQFYPFDIILHSNNFFYISGLRNHPGGGIGDYPGTFGFLIRLNQDGDIDSSFGNDSIYSEGPYQQYYDIKSLSNGNILIGKQDIGVPLMKIIDVSGNLIQNSQTGLGCYANNLVLQSDNKIVFSGQNFKIGRLNQNNIIDVTFGINGYSNQSINGIQNNMNVLPNDKIVLVGNYGNDMAISKHNTNGCLDTDFSEDGILIIDIFGKEDSLSALAPISVSQFIVVGYATNMSNKDFIILKYNADGTLDSSFGNNGQVLSDFSESIDSGVQHVVLENGKMVAAVQSFNHLNYNLIGFNSDGSLDTSFGIIGKVSTTVSNTNNDNVSVLLSDQNQKIWAFGSGGIIRYNADGSHDSTFGNNGIFSSLLGGIRAAAFQNDGKFIIGFSYYSSGSILKRYNSDCTIDTTFGTNGSVTIPGGSQGEMGTLKILNDQSILVTSNDKIYKYNSNGVLNNSFGGGLGYAIGYTDSILLYNLDVFPDGRIIIIGGSGYGGNGYIRRYLSNGLLDPDFSEDGEATYDFPNIVSSTIRIKCQSDGKSIISYINDVNENQNLIVTRTNYDGTIDTTFGTNGYTEIDYQGKNNNGNFISLFEDKILITGTLINNNNQDVVLYRLNNDYVVGVNDLLKASTKVFPNPFTDYLNIESDMGAIDTVTIYDTKGSLCGTYNANQIDLSHLKAGKYFVKITQNDKSFVAKVFKN